MCAEFVSRVEEEGVHLQLRSADVSHAATHWAQVGGQDGKTAAAVALANAIVEAEEAKEGDYEILIPHPRAARLTNREAMSFGMPAPARVTLDLRNEGTFDQREFRFSYRWLRPNGQPVVMPTRVGAFLFIAGKFERLPYEGFALIERIEAFNASSVDDPDTRYRTWAELQELLPGEVSSEIRLSGYLNAVRIAYAGAFSLDIGGDPADIHFDPVLHAASPKTFSLDPAGEPRMDDAEVEPRSLLPPGQQENFARRRFPAFREAHIRYALGDGWYVVLAEPVHRALQVVRLMQDASGEVRRDFVRNPRTYMREALGADYDETVIENLFVETAAYSNRVQKIGLWQPKVLPWIVLARQPWLPPERYGIFVSGNRIELEREEVDGLISKIETAMEQGQASIPLRDQEIPATDDTLGALREIAAKAQTASSILDKGATEEESIVSQPDASPCQEGKKVLLIEDNLEALGFEAPFERREPLLGSELPSSLKTELKLHQQDGIEWLRENWRAGRPGVLLADDMGLGKTLQALVFLASIKVAMRKGLIRQAPLLTVAPSGLLSNWEKEHGLHLDFPGLGRIVRAHGPDLVALRRITGRETDLAAPALRYEKLLEADWILTTYETLRDYQHSFGKIPFAVIVFDEVQKTKTPGTLVTEATKAMKAEFVLTMTGTPVENRLADIWCITDTAQPGLLGDLKTFSSRFEQRCNPAELTALKERLSRRTPSRPAVMLRRLKADHLPGLPEKHEHIVERRMPEVQAEYYRKAVQEAREDRSRGKLLQVLQKLRVLSLHPLPPGAAADDQYIAASARYSEVFEILDRVHKAGEKALIFLEFLEPQAYLATLLQRRYSMESPPLLINGAVTGRRRQERVDRFQAGLPGFDVILLSPRAGGVGITLTAANHVIHLSRWWNPAVEDQCTDRVYRIGQTKPVNVYYPVALFPDDEEHSFDRRLHALLTEKRSLSRDLLIPPMATEKDVHRLYEETIG